jgi:UDPglucose--hexose-1-phosphate uridylyltransferase
VSNDTPVSRGAAELRRDRLTGAEVIVAPRRGDRPHPAAASDCPFCPGNEQQTPAAALTLTRPGSPEPWAVRVVPNLFPVVTAVRADSVAGKAPFQSGAATGTHEVVIETPSHTDELPDQEQWRVTMLLGAVQQRFRDLEARAGTRYVVFFKNRGGEAGTSLAHPHSQIVALNFLPDRVRRRVQTAQRYFRRTGACLLCDEVGRERNAGARIIFEEDGFMAFAPYASSSPGEALLVPLTHSPSFSDAPAEACEALSRGLQALLRASRAALNDPPYNLVLHTAPKRRQADVALHWYWQMTPRLTRDGGLELGTGLRINPLTPEEAARLLRGVSG